MSSPTIQYLKSNPIGGRIYLYCVYEWKNELKKIGPFNWDNTLKLWFINVDKLTDEIFFKTRMERIFEDKNPLNTKTYYYTKYYTRSEFNDRCYKFNINPDEYIKLIN